MPKVTDSKLGGSFKFPFLRGEGCTTRSREVYQREIEVQSFENGQMRIFTREKDELSVHTIKDEAKSTDFCQKQGEGGHILLSRITRQSTGGKGHKGDKRPQQRWNKRMSPSASPERSDRKRFDLRPSIL